MELEQLKIFIAAAEKNSFTAAGKGLYISHSTVSRAISALEDEFSLKFFERAKNGVSLTSEGEELYERALEILNLVDDLGKSLRNRGDMEK